MYGIGKAYPENSHPEHPHLSISPQESPTPKIPTRNIPIHVFEHFVFHYYHRYHQYCLKDCYLHVWNEVETWTSDSP